MMRSKVRNTQMGLEPCHGGWWPQPLMYVPYRWRAALCQLCPDWAHEERLANSSAGTLLSRVPYAAWFVSLKAFRLLNKCRTYLIINRFMIMKNKYRHTREAARACTAVPGRETFRKVGWEERTLQTAWQTSLCIIFEAMSSRKVHCFRFTAPSPGSLN